MGTGTQRKPSERKVDYGRKAPTAMNKPTSVPRTAFPSSQARADVAPEAAGSVTDVVARAVVDVLAVVLVLVEVEVVDVVSSLLTVVLSLLVVVSLVGRRGEVGVGWFSSSLVVGSEVVGSSLLVVGGTGTVTGGGGGLTDTVGAGFAVVVTPEPSHVFPSGQQPPNASQYVPDLHHPPAPS
jgi:hypothetical protein